MRNVSSLFFGNLLIGLSKKDRIHDNFIHRLIRDKRVSARLMFHRGNWSSSCPRCRADVHPTKTGHGWCRHLYTGSSPASKCISTLLDIPRILFSPSFFYYTEQCKFLLPPSSAYFILFTHDDSFIEEFHHFFPPRKIQIHQMPRSFHQSILRDAVNSNPPLAVALI